MTFGGDAIHKFKKERLPVEFLPSRGGKLAFPWHIYKLYHFCQNNHITLIHAHHRYFDFIGSIVAKLLTIPIVTSVQSKVYSKRLLSYRANHFIAAGETIKKHLITKFHIPAEKISVINNFIDEADYDSLVADREEFKKELGIFGNRTVIVFIGRFSKEKGIDVLLQAFRKLQAEYFDLQLLLVGNGEERKKVVEFTKTKLKDVKIIDAQENIAPYYQIADIIVLPSRVDPFPLVMLEAGFMEKPLIGTNVDGIAEFIKDGQTGVLVGPGNRDDLVAGLSKLLDSAPFRLGIAERLHRKVMSTSLKEHLLPKYYSLYTALSNK
jgi:glycosyltransferase involved in cell wall biosynthesis